MSDEPTRITEKGIEQAVTILLREGFLGDAASDITSEILLLQEACRKYVEVSVAKGTHRSNAECAEAILIGFFQAYLDDVYRTMVN
jgi:hypothetical protein